MYAKDFDREGHKSLLGIFLSDRLPPATPLSHHAVLIVDQEKRFCKRRLLSYIFEDRGTAQTQRTAKHNAFVLNRFRLQDAPVYIVHFGQGDLDHEKVNQKLFKISAQPNNYVIGKNKNSAMAGSDLDQKLKDDHRKTLWIMGFNLSACIAQTAIDAVKKGYEVYVLIDCVADGKFAASDLSAIQEMRDAGVKFAYSDEALDYFAQINPGLENDSLTVHDIEATYNNLWPLRECSAGF